MDQRTHGKPEKGSGKKKCGQLVPGSLKLEYAGGRWR